MNLDPGDHTNFNARKFGAGAFGAATALSAAIVAGALNAFPPTRRYVSRRALRIRAENILQLERDYLALRLERAGVEIAELRNGDSGQREQYAMARLRAL
jgi:hypothetical protein